MKANLVFIRFPADGVPREKEFEVLQRVEGIDNPIVPRIGENIDTPESTGDWEVVKINYSYRNTVELTHPSTPQYSASVAVTVATIRIFVK